MAPTNSGDESSRRLGVCSLDYVFISLLLFTLLGLEGGLNLFAVLRNLTVLKYPFLSYLLNLHSWS